ncbi:MAG: efflux RND transporter periplasmic adaptor subunit [Bacteroides sp.]|nr:efflux RND transporter periplasmic adaptor subunit [Bacteroides sp.]
MIIRNIDKWIISFSLLWGMTACSAHSDSHDDHDIEETEAAEEHHHEGAIVMEPEKAAGFGVRVETMTPGQFSEVIKVSGRIEPAPTDRLTVTARKSGIFTMSPGLAEGSKVNAGTAIGSISSKGMQGGDANAAARATLNAAKKELDRLTPLYKDGLVTASVYNEAERAYNEAQALAADTPTTGNSVETAPTTGTLTNLMVTSGQYVEAGTPIATVTKNSRLTLRADVPAKYYHALPSITSANFRPEYSEQIFSIASLDGKRISSTDISESTNGYIPLYFSFISNGETIPGSFAEIYLTGSPRENVLTVPKDALIEMQGNKYIYICEDGHAYEKRLVKTGASDGNRVEITEGIENGEQYVAAGTTIIRMAETSAIAPPGHTHNH